MSERPPMPPLPPPQQERPLTPPTPRWVLWLFLATFCAGVAGWIFILAKGIR